MDARAYQNMPVNNINAGAQAIRMTDLEELRSRLDGICQSLWQSNESLASTQDRVFGSAPETSGKAAAQPLSKGGLLGDIERTINSLSEAASAIEERARRFNNLA